MTALIETVYQETSKVLQELYSKRKRTLFFQKIMWVITGVFFILMLLPMVSVYIPSVEFDFLKPFMASNTNPYASLYPIVVLAVLLYPATYFFTSTFQKFKIKENETIVKMVKRLFPKVDFAQNTMAPTNEIISSKLFAWVKKDAPIYGYGHIQSKVNDTVINITDVGIIEADVSNKLSATLMHIPLLNMAVVLYQYVLKNIITNKTADNIQYTFRGMFCWLVYPKKLLGHTVVLTNNQKLKIERGLSSKFSEEQKVLLEDPRFTDQFIVYSTDQVEARYVLSTALMERITSLKEQFNQPILLSFHNQQMYLAVENSNGLFSFPSGKLDDIKIIEAMANDIETALHISESLKMG